MRNRGITLLLAVFLASETAASDTPSLQFGTVIEAAEKLKPGQFLWAPQIAPEGPLLVAISLKTQRAVVYRNGIPIGISTVSTGRSGYATPTGVFVILQKHVEHYSNLYDNAPMPYMQRLTWGGIALHAGNLPGYPASHGCVRLPHDFARLLYGVTKRGMTVVITDGAVLPRIAPAAALLEGAREQLPLAGNAMLWNPGYAPDGPISIVISSSDRRVMVLRDGIVIGSSPVEIDGTISQTTAYLLAGVIDGKRNWVRIGLPGQIEQLPETLRGRLRVSEEFRRLVDPTVKIGTTVVVTGDSLQTVAPGKPLTVIESDRPN